MAAAICVQLRPEAHWDQFTGWDHHGTKTPNFVAVFSWFSGVRTIESSLSYGAGDGNRTHVRSLESFYTAIVRRPHFAQALRLYIIKPLLVQTEGVHDRVYSIEVSTA
jgi:hypothetical protein